MFNATFSSSTSGQNSQAFDSKMYKASDFSSLLECYVMFEVLFIQSFVKDSAVILYQSIYAGLTYQQNKTNILPTSFNHRH